MWKYVCLSLYFLFPMFGTFLKTKVFVTKVHFCFSFLTQAVYAAAVLFYIFVKQFVCLCFTLDCTIFVHKNVWKHQFVCLFDSSVVTCDIPAEVANGKRSWESGDYPTYGQVIQYTCDDGYTLFGKDTLVCSDFGEYDSEPPECKSKHTPSFHGFHLLLFTPMSQRQAAVDKASWISSTV